MWKALILIILIVVISCRKRKEPTLWDVQMASPVAHGELTIHDLLPDSILQTNTDQSISINLTTNLYRLDLDSIVNIPDTGLSDTFAIPFPIPVNVSPGQTFITQPEENFMDAGGAELTLIKVKQGSISYSLKSTIQGKIIYEYQIPSAIDENGNSFSQNVFVPSAPVNGVAVMSGNFDLSGYTIDLSGTNGNQFNTIRTNINVTVDPTNAGDVSASNQDTIYVDNILSDIKISYAKGYFGQQNFSISSTEKINAFNKIISGNINIDELSVDFILTNGAGIDGRFSLEKISSINNNGNTIALNHSSIGEVININRAYEIGSLIHPYLFNENYSNANSNIDYLLENLPDSIGASLTLELNPLGNVSGHNDFISAESPIKADLAINMPLSIIASNLNLSDTLVISIPDTIGITNGNLYIEINNGFPLGANLDIELLDQNKMVVDHILSPAEIPSATINSSGIVTNSSYSSHTLSLGEKNMEILKKNKTLLLKVIFNTPSANHINIYDYNKLKFTIKSDFGYGIEIK